MAGWTNRRHPRRGRRHVWTWRGRWHRPWTPLEGRLQPCQLQRRATTGPAGCRGTASARERSPPRLAPRRRGRGRAVRRSSSWRFDRRLSYASLSPPLLRCVCLYSTRAEGRRHGRPGCPPRPVRRPAGCFLYTKAIERNGSCFLYTKKMRNFCKKFMVRSLTFVAMLSFQAHWHLYIVDN